MLDPEDKEVIERFVAGLERRVKHLEVQEFRHSRSISGIHLVNWFLVLAVLALTLKVVFG